MKMKVLRMTLPTAALIFAASTNLQAAPSLPITEPPVSSTFLDGPPPDPGSTNGQWFINLQGTEEYRTHEFHDNLIDHGGGNVENLAIEGIVVSAQFGGAGIPGVDPLIKFDIDATIFNDTPTTEGQESAGSNSHLESRPAGTEQYIGTLFDTKLTAEFSIIDTNTLPFNFTGPYRHPGYPSWIIADNEDQFAWYCWDGQDPPNGQDPGSYYVPTWDFGNIDTNQSVTRTLSFSVDPPMPTTDPRYNIIFTALEQGMDIFLNRTTSLKISTWIDNPSFDPYIPYPENEALRSSDVSVFHDIDAPYDDVIDWGDAPDSIQAPKYPTLAINNGASHIANPGLYLGLGIDSELDGQPSINALGDDLNLVYPGILYPPGDEDGILFTSLLVIGQQATLTATLGSSPGNAYLDAWVDFNLDGDWNDPGEQVFTSLLLAGGPNALSFNVPATASTGWSYARFRLSLTGGMAPAGAAGDGEVEDYKVYIEPLEDDHKMHYPQYPDPDGWDVRACETPPTDIEPDGIQKVLADDFLCTSNGYITKITFWGSWFFDEFPDETQHPFQGITNIHLSLHADIPDPDEYGPEFSKPVVPALWERNFDPVNPPASWVVLPPEEEPPSWQGWYDPNTGQWQTNNHMRYFRYEVDIPESEAYYQTNGTIYWLDISVQTLEGLWGWKTSRSPHFNDDGVWADMPVLDPLQWGELRDPIYSNSLDLAFIINGGDDEPQEQYDFGDAPDTGQGTGPGNYETTLADNGAHHMVVVGAPYFDDGSQSDQPDVEPDGQQDPNAKGDDSDYLSPPNDDEDGIFIPVLVAGQAGTVIITVDDGGSGTMGAYVDAWIDFNADGDWTDANESIVSGWLTQGANPIVVNVPPGANIGQTFARFRINSVAAGLTPTGGPAVDGEVEDHEVAIELPKDWGDAPDPTYPTVSASGGAAHSIAGGANALRLGTLIDSEPDGQPTNAADGDDVLDGNDDEEGIVFTSPIVPGIRATLDATAFAGGVSGYAYLQGWMDFNADGDWVDPGEQIFTDQVVNFGATPTINNLSYWVPTTATNAPSFARFRLSLSTGVGIGGLAASGEVEDYEILIEDNDVDWGDLPEPGYPVTAANNGAHHIITPFLFLGGFCDGETNGQPTINADGDDLNGLPDEDGVILKSAIMVGGYAYIDVIAAQPGILDAWLDFNADSSFAQPGDTIFSGQPLPQGTNALIFPVPLTASGSSPAHARFRFTSGSGAYPGGIAIPTGLAFDGEVEDYHWLIRSVESGLDWGDARDPGYPTLAGSVGASHTILAGVILGSSVDAEPDGQPNNSATGDDSDILYGPPLFDDEDGVMFSSKLVAGTNASVDVVAGVSGGMLDAWIDFNADGDWLDTGEQIFSSTPVAAGMNNLSFPVPQPSALGQTFSRFRISSAGGLSFSGSAADGEVEDYTVDLYQPIPTNLVITNLTFLAGSTNAVVEWTVENNILYQMQASTNLTTNVWADVATAVLGPNNSQTNNMAAETNKFYRITVPWTP